MHAYSVFRSLFPFSKSTVPVARELIYLAEVSKVQFLVLYFKATTPIAVLIGAFYRLFSPCKVSSDLHYKFTQGVMPWISTLRVFSWFVVLRQWKGICDITLNRTCYPRWSLHTRCVVMCMHEGARAHAHRDNPSLLSEAPWLGVREHSFSGGEVKGKQRHTN